MDLRRRDVQSGGQIDSHDPVPLAAIDRERDDSIVFRIDRLVLHRGVPVALALQLALGGEPGVEEQVLIGRSLALDRDEDVLASRQFPLDDQFHEGSRIDRKDQIDFIAVDDRF